MRAWDLSREAHTGTGNSQSTRLDSGGVEEVYLDLLSDPQTSGGLLCQRA